MAFCARAACSLKSHSRPIQVRNFCTSGIVRNDTLANTGSAQPERKPIGGFRGGCVFAEFLNTESEVLFLQVRIVGFLLGFSLASSFAAYHLLDEYQRASAALQTSVEELKISTEKVRQYLVSLSSISYISRFLRMSDGSRRLRRIWKLSVTRLPRKKIYPGSELSQRSYMMDSILVSRKLTS